jgi:hypothetical protein
MFPQCDIIVDFLSAASLEAVVGLDMDLLTFKSCILIYRDVVAPFRLFMTRKFLQKVIINIKCKITYSNPHVAGGPKEPFYFELLRTIQFPFLKSMNLESIQIFFYLSQGFVPECNYRERRWQVCDI